MIGLGQNHQRICRHSFCGPITGIFDPIESKSFVLQWAQSFARYAGWMPVIITKNQGLHTVEIVAGFIHMFEEFPKVIICKISSALRWSSSPTALNGAIAKSKRMGHIETTSNNQNFCNRKFLLTCWSRYAFGYS